MSDIVKLVPRETQPVDQDTIDLLKSLLKSAEAGHINGIALITLTVLDGRMVEGGTTFSGSVRGNVASALGTVEILRARLMRDLVEWPVG